MATVVQVSEAAAQHGISSVAPELHAFLSTALDAHLSGLIRRAGVAARQRADVGRRVPGMEVGHALLNSHTRCCASSFAHALTAVAYTSTAC